MVCYVPVGFGINDNLLNGIVVTNVGCDVLLWGMVSYGLVRSGMGLFQALKYGVY